MITGNVIGSIMKDPGTIILVDEQGNEYPAVFTGQSVELTATTNDIREGKTAALTRGFATGEKVIPAYHTFEGTKLILEGQALTIENSNASVNSYDYTKLQAMICSYNTDLSNSVSTEKVSINNNVYNVQSTVSISTVTKDHTSKLINLGFTNDTGGMLIIRYIMYKEIE